MSDTEDIIKLAQWQSKVSEIPGAKEKMRIEVGRTMWTYFHALDKWTPPDTASQTKIWNTFKEAVNSFACHECAEHGDLYIKYHPFRPGTDNFQAYLCEFQNLIAAHKIRDQHEHANIFDCEYYCQTGEYKEGDLNKYLSALPPADIKNESPRVGEVGKVVEVVEVGKIVEVDKVDTYIQEDKIVYLDPLHMFPMRFVNREVE